MLSVVGRREGPMCFQRQGSDLPPALGFMPDLLYRLFNYGRREQPQGWLELAPGDLPPTGVLLKPDKSYLEDHGQIYTHERGHLL